MAGTVPARVVQRLRREEIGGEMLALRPDGDLLISATRAADHERSSSRLRRGIRGDDLGGFERRRDASLERDVRHRLRLASLASDGEPNRRAWRTAFYGSGLSHGVLLSRPVRYRKDLFAGMGSNQ